MTPNCAPPELPFDAALFLDFDGTLTPLQDNPEACFLNEAQLDVLQRLNTQLQSALAVISGRDVRDLSKRVPTSLYRAGSHGLEICAPDVIADYAAEPAPPSLIAAINKCLDARSGTRLELKGEVLAVHYRHAPKTGEALFIELKKIADKYPDYKLQHGKFVIEAKPKRANKGAAIEQIMGFSAFHRKTPIMIGDDTTDEDAMKIVRQLGGWSIKVGDGDTVANYRVATPDDVWSWLEKVNV